MVSGVFHVLLKVLRESPRPLILSIAALALPFVFCGEFSLTRFRAFWQPVTMSASPFAFNHTSLIITTSLLFVLSFALPDVFQVPKKFLRSIWLKNALPWAFFSYASFLLAVTHPNEISVPSILKYWGTFLSESLLWIAIAWSFVKDRVNSETILKRLLVSIGVAIAVQLTFSLTSNFVEFFRFWSLEGTFRILKWFIPNTMLLNRTSSTLRLGGFEARIEPSCAGIEGVAVVTVILLAFIWLFRKQLNVAKSLIMLPVGISLAWSANVLRMVGLFLYGHFISRQGALDAFHTHIGWLLFNFVALACVTVLLNFPFFSRIPVQNEESPSLLTHPSAQYLLPLVVLMLLSLFTGLFFHSLIDPLYIVRICGAMFALFVLWKSRTPLMPLLKQASWLTPFATGLLVFGIWLLAETVRMRFGGIDQRLVHSFTESNYQLVMCVIWAIGSTIIIPIVEELAFRGYLMRRMSSRTQFHDYPYHVTTLFALLLSSAIFAVGHRQFIGGLIAGLAFGWIAKKENNLFAAILAHMTTNALWALHIFVTGSWYFLA